ncbi:M67 family metallopeptidase [Spirulina sp. CS-785/01]|uniref:M67 family metallopeptidase n=1 Tax=Spirulina sp. CS-785/01 TaxID=3021716 RepID=UPI00232E34A4|nr:M67 family metallopeptidase [Spirulina sp. CS-785/01]MDB9314261.1 M67 family metallopeptidase [Spirulina sp. CS-785/01]
MTLQFPTPHLETLRTHAATTYPQECCGILLGKNQHILEIRPTENGWSADYETLLATATGLTMENRGKQDSFIISPQDLLNAQKDARERELQIIGFYHSHPDHPATPSEFDRAIAWPDYSYLIITVPQGQPGELRSWQLDSQGQFQPQPIQITA